MLALQAADAVPLKPGVESFDLRHAKPAQSGGCTSQSSSDIVVCGSRRDSYRYRDVASGPEPQLPRAEISLPGGASAKAHLDGAAMPNGMTSKRVMITIKKPF